MIDVSEVNKIIAIWFTNLKSFRSSSSHKNVNIKDLEALEKGLEIYISNNQEVKKDE